MPKRKAKVDLFMNLLRTIFFPPQLPVSSPEKGILTIPWSPYYLDCSERLMGSWSTYYLEQSERLKASWSTYYLERSERLKESWSLYYLERSESL